MTKDIKLTYYGQVLSKKNSKRIIRNRHTGRPMIVSNNHTQANEYDMTRQFKEQFQGRTPIYKCKIAVRIFEPNFHQRDLDNQLTTILDALVKAEVIADDSFKCVVEEKVRFGGIDKNEPRAIVIITEVKDDK